MDEQILEGLKNQFKKHRIVFWYDDAKDMRETFESLRLDSVEKVEETTDEKEQIKTEQKIESKKEEPKKEAPKVAAPTTEPKKKELKK